MAAMPSAKTGAEGIAGLLRSRHSPQRQSCLSCASHAATIFYGTGQRYPSYAAKRPLAAPKDSVDLHLDDNLHLQAPSGLKFRA